MAAVTDYCPTCGSPNDDAGECSLCQVYAPPNELTMHRDAYASCRRCGALLSKRAAACRSCGTDHPSSRLAIAPVGLFVLSLFALAAILGIISFLVGPLVS